MYNHTCSKLRHKRFRFLFFGSCLWRTDNGILICYKHFSYKRSSSYTRLSNALLFPHGSNIYQVQIWVCNGRLVRHLCLQHVDDWSAPLKGLGCFITWMWPLCGSRIPPGIWGPLKSRIKRRVMKRRVCAIARTFVLCYKSLISH